MTEQLIPILTTHCQNKQTCPDGNCPGCHDFGLFCEDDRCHPHCEDCPGVRNKGTITAVGIIIVIIAVILLIVGCFWAYTGFQEPDFMFGMAPDHSRYSSITEPN